MSPNEATDHRENAPNEATDPCEIVPNEPTWGGQRNEGGHAGVGTDGFDRTVPIVRGDHEGNETNVNPVATQEAFESY